MLRLYVTLLISIITITQSQAQQRWRVGVKGGISLPNLQDPSGNDNSQAYGYSSIMGPYFGIVTDYRIRESLSFQGEINYATQGGQKNGDQKIRTVGFESFIPAGVQVPEYVFTRFDNKVVLHYIEIAALAKYYLINRKHWNVTINAGPYFGILTYAHNTSKGTSKVYYDAQYTQPLLPYAVVFDNEEDIQPRVNPYALGIQGGGTIGYKLKQWEIFISGGGNIGLTILQSDKSLGSNRTGAGTLTTGVFFQL
ncbi:MAG: porin family protein [Chitinophagaceae bacterium]|jgi:hypothetical protein